MANQNKKGKWKGIQVNFAIFQGEITTDPTQHGDYVFLTLQTAVVQRDKNGQVVELEQDIPLMVEPDGPTSVAKNYIKAGRKVMVWCHYKSWVGEDGQINHAFVVKKFNLGDKPYEDVDMVLPPPVS